jgi:hypothetical protein
MPITSHRRHRRPIVAVELVLRESGLRGI